MSGTSMSERERKVLEALADLGIPYARHEHPPVFTVEEAEVHWVGIQGAHCKNLFVRNQRGNRHYLIIVPAAKKAGLQDLARKLGEDRFSFASAERLARYLGVEPGAVSPFGLPRPMRILADESVFAPEEISIGSGVRGTTVILKSADLRRALGKVEVGRFGT